MDKGIEKNDINYWESANGGLYKPSNEIIKTIDPALERDWEDFKKAKSNVMPKQIVTAPIIQEVINEPVTSSIEPKKDFMALLNEEQKAFEATNKERDRIEKQISQEPDKVLGESIFNDLPELMREGVLKFISQSEKEVFFISLLGVVSGMLPNVIGVYDGREVYANLYVYLIGKYGTGKGTQIFARMIAQITHGQLRDESLQAEIEYKAKLSEYEELKKKKLPAEQPIEPKHKTLILPANISQSGMMQLMGDNDGRGIIIESETDTMTNSQELSDYSSNLRAYFQHETVSVYRKTNREHVEIERPQLSIILTSTHDQLKKFIPSVTNGLFSRFLFYDMKSNREFKDVFDERQTNFPTYFKSLGERYQRIYTYLIALEEPIIFDYTPSQKQKLVSEFRLLKNEIGEYVSEDLDGTINRLGLICFRISMIFATLRAFSDGEVLAKIICQDVDFNNAFRIVRILLKHAIEIYFTMPKPTEYAKEETVFDDGKANLIRQAKIMKAQGVPLRKIALDLLGSESKKTSVSRWLVS